MLETKIAENTAALAALAAAVADLTAAIRAGNLSEIPTSSPAPDVPVPVSAPAPVDGELYARAGVAGLTAGDGNFLAASPVAPVAAAPAAPAAPAPVAAPAPAPVAAAPAALTGDDLRKLCVKAGAAGLTAEVVQFLSDHGVAKLAALPPADYPALVALLASKGVQ